MLDKDNGIREKGMAEVAFSTPTLLEAIEWLKGHDWVYYHAPMDYRPSIVKVRSVTLWHGKPERCRATLWSANTGAFAVNVGEHLERFRLRAGSQAKGDK